MARRGRPGVAALDLGGSGVGAGAGAAAGEAGAEEAGARPLTPAYMPVTPSYNPESPVYEPTSPSYAMEFAREQAASVHRDVFGSSATPSPQNAPRRMRSPVTPSMSPMAAGSSALGRRVRSESQAEERNVRGRVQPTREEEQ
eukprot:1973168-Rhodomonas_salina.1